MNQSKEVSAILFLPKYHEKYRRHLFCILCMEMTEIKKETKKQFQKGPRRWCPPDLSSSEQTFFSPQMKRSVIVSNKHGIYKLSHNLLYHLIIKKYQQNPKFSQNYSLVPTLSSKKEFFYQYLQKTIGKKKFAPDCFKFGLFDNFLTLRSLSQFQPKIRATNMQKVLVYNLFLER